MIILGIDPGVATTGWAIVDFDKDGNPKPIDYGVVSTSKKLSLSERLCEIYKDISELVEKYKPEYGGVETLLFSKNVKTAIAVGEARGVVLLVFEQNNIPIKDVNPMQVKNCISGYGKADKKQVQENVKMICNLEEIPKPDDAADAIAIAITTDMILKQ
ncbi:MAG: crossover junction endodeoxyribonuclease RuvC [Candidatus Dojkabacteria bacterium]|nr:crossover junction endodeoxyribonuclease RuvC [Candidatus Dojkabacteria bacterium]